ncbi:putative methyltransferase, partial [Candidatus Termititenax aidoneus]
MKQERTVTNCLKKIFRLIIRFIPPIVRVPLTRLMLAGIYDKTRFSYKNNKNVFEIIYADNVWGSPESRSGGGSEIATTKTIRMILPKLWKKYKIKTFLDIPCGDYNWMQEVNKEDIIYIGGDIVQEIIAQNKQKYAHGNISFAVLDITSDVLPQVDMIFCKDCLQHLSYANVRKALLNFQKSKSRYLLTTTYPLTLRNWDILDGDCRPLNLRK